MKIEFITPQQAENIKRTMPKSKVMEEYESYWKQLPKGQVGKMVVGTKDDIRPQTIKARLNRAGKNLDMDCQIKRIGDTVLFWCN